MPADGAVTQPLGFRASGVKARIKSDKKDIALIVSDVPAVAAGLFTTNRIQAAPVKLCRANLRHARARAVIVNSGNANACTGPRGLADARRMRDLTAEAVGTERESVFVCSTGTIGVPMPMPRVEAGIRLAFAGLSRAGGADAARAIMTTDTRKKEFVVRLVVDRRPVTIAGMAKGAGMIHPRMATLLVFLTTDAAVRKPALQAALAGAVAGSFNRISVDGDTSTNDTVLCLANGVAGNRLLSPRHPQWNAFRDALQAVCRELALRIVEDGEGATKCVTVTVRGAVSPADAEKAARAIANSLLVKTSWYGQDPNWGRIICAVGYSGARVEETKADIAFDRVVVLRRGRVRPAAAGALPAILAKKSFSIGVDLNLGKAEYSILTCDCSEEYVRINGAYMT
ncbi:MAG: bifunctional glutamate N-acetyltransferase/amino-acid acetyltransferase ArgJ [Lentisphaerae bacterium]|nr:bifunctional glutamate N-acetyltransferase/amino-acid acetyltransferase ArgJ [Lentisphaerota bacterium]